MAEVPARPRREAAVAGLFLVKALGRWVIVIAIAITALILGGLGLNDYLSHQAASGFGQGWSDILFYDVQLFVLNAAPAEGAGPFPVALEIARFLAPAATVVATVETVRLVLRDQLRRWSATSVWKHAVVTGDGPFARELARKLTDEYRKVVLVSTNPAPAEQVRGHRLFEASGDPTDPGVLRAAGPRRMAVLYACAEHSTTNAATALRARELAESYGRPLTVFAQVRDAEISVALKARRIGAEADLRFRLDFFSVEDIAARVLLDKHLLVPGGTPPDQVVIVGFDRLGRAVLCEIARRQKPGGSPRSVILRDQNPEVVSHFKDRFPVVGRNCAVFSDQEADALPRLADDAASLILVCLPDNDDSLSVGLAAAHSMTGPFDRAVICMSQPSPFGAVLTGQQALLDDVEGRLTVFEVIEEACVPERIREDLQDQLARAIHQAYLDHCVARGETPSVNRSMRPWEELPDNLKRANLAQAAHIGVKLEEIGCVVVPERANAPDFAFSPAEIERLAQLEHQRWVAERQSQGYVYGPNREAKQSPDMVDWEYLSETAKEKDRDAIRELPAILRDAGFQILRLPLRSA